ncbi:MAG: LuxR C-terminal-related transcriptional regulator [Lachnospiraceae bacterium]
MKTLETNDWTILNNIIYKIYTTLDSNVMREQLLEQMKMMLDFDSADFYLADHNGTNHLVEPVLYNCEANNGQLYEELEHSRGIMLSGKSMAFRETDIISDEKRMEMNYYKNLYLPNNWHYSLQLILGRGKDFLGVVTFYRTIGKDNFQYDDIFLLDMLKEHLAYRLHQDKMKYNTNAGKLSVTDATLQFELTKRENTILRLLMNGLDNTEICERLTISVNTLKKHILNIYRKIGIKNRVQLFKMIRETE